MVKSFPQEGGKSAVECKVRRVTASEPCNPSRAGSIGLPRLNVDQAALFLQALNCKQISRKSNNWVSAHLVSCGQAWRSRWRLSRYSRSTGRRELRQVLDCKATPGDLPARIGACCLNQKQGDSAGIRALRWSSRRFAGGRRERNVCLGVR